jgi:stearoyl-CoA desaturase (delta-9 desaturase)
MPLPASLAMHRVRHREVGDVVDGEVVPSLVKAVWFLGMLAGTAAGAVFFFSVSGLVLFLASTAVVLLFGHSLGSHRKLVHDSYQCPRWLEYTFVYLGVQVGLAGPIGLLRQHEMRDYAQRLPQCHPYLRHGSAFWRDAWWQLCCELHLARTPAIALEERVAADRFYRWLERTWMAQHVPWAILFHLWGGWAFVLWGVCARVTAGVLGHWIIGYLAHNHGDVERMVVGAAVQGRNVRWTSLLTMGECWHNNHHAFPGSARLGLRTGEWDPGWWVLAGLARVNLVWDIRLPADLLPRAELRTLSPAGRLA